MANGIDRRQLFRIRPGDMWGKVAGVTVRILDLSLGGVKVAKDDKTQFIGSLVFELEYDDLLPVEVHCIMLQETEQFARFKFFKVNMVQETRLARIITHWQLKRALIMKEKKDKS